jgi:demethylmenaquinone methyltransferase/2-methoxy-6-polyprenyl-1,4-benzoquinol methylase/phosphoethanolamine N-methyltransferase
MSENIGKPAPHTHGSVIHWARLYDLLTRLPGMGGDARHRETLDRADLRPGESVLDAGCGPGALAILAKERAQDGDVYGIDPSREMIDLARKKAARRRIDAHFELAAIEDLPFPNGRFDLVVSSYMLHHLPADLKRTGMREVARVLKPGGRLLAVDITGKGSLFWRLMRLAGHRVADDYPDELAGIMREAGHAPALLDSTSPQQFHILARKA